MPYTTEGDFSGTWTEITAGLHDANDQIGVNAFEIIALMSQANAAPVGTKSVAWFKENIGMNNEVDNNVNIQTLGLTLTNTNSPLFAKHRRNHSFQFHHDAVATWKFWKEVKDRTGFDGT